MRLVGFGTLAAAGLIACSPPLEARAGARVFRTISPALETWLAAVRGHSPGQQDRATRLVASWPRSDLDAILAELKPFVENRAPRRRVGWASREDAERTLKRAALLHADIAAMHRGVDGYALPSDGRVLTVVADGQQVGARSGTVHWSFGRRLLDVLQADDDVRLWYRASAAFLQSWNEYSELEPHLKRARTLFPRDAVLLLYEGTLHETYAEPRIQNAYKAAEGASTKGRRPVDDANGEWREAERRFEKALEIDPGLTEARIRLAHVRGMRGRHEEAAADLRRCVEEPLPAVAQYYAWLLLGREEQSLARRGAARAAFARAMALYPGAQSPWLGLSQLARDEGDRKAALGVLDLLSTRADVAVDPWWIYSRVHAPDVDELFADLRRRLAP